MLVNNHNHSLTHHIKWAVSSKFCTYHLCEQRRFRQACASAQSCQNLHCSLIQAERQEEHSDRKPDPWPLWMAGHAQLKFVMTECSKTQIRLTRHIYDICYVKMYLQSNMLMIYMHNIVSDLYFPSYLAKLIRYLPCISDIKCGLDVIFCSTHVEVDSFWNFDIIFRQNSLDWNLKHTFLQKEYRRTDKEGIWW